MTITPFSGLSRPNQLSNANSSGLWLAGGSAPAPFSPLDYGPSLWLDASDTATIIETLGAVSQWNDKSGNGYNATQGTGANQPTTGTRTKNSLNVLDFDGTTDYMDLPAGAYNIANTDNTTFVVQAMDGAGGERRAFSGQTAASTYRYGSRFDYAGNSITAIQNTIFAPASKTIAFGTNVHVISHSKSGATLSFYYDGGVASTAAGANVVVTGLRIGATPGTAANFYDGVITEILVYPTALSQSNYNTVGAYLATKWGFTWTNI